ncbi:hypothetical protein F5876DRAFT_84648 [Lentinula aff. lateritia]|uniref:Uncharacterized protein n=1 Tax=Lentinula aff. lateritia TaxID=2804960 RepID=A0ACC1TGM0_9AGAR|nr:hypothetical protein F5876DRAFT_84648 [Lentinula aff. lateritia]
MTVSLGSLSSMGDKDLSLELTSYNQPSSIDQANIGDANGAIHFQNSGHSPHPPLLTPSSSCAFSSQSQQHFTAAGGLVVSKPVAKGVSSKPPSKLPEQPASQDGRFTSAQKVKKKPLTRDQSTLAQLLTALNKLQSDFTTFLNDFNHNSQPPLPSLPPSSAASPPPSAPTTSLSTLTPQFQDFIPNIMPQTRACPDLLSCLLYHRQPILPSPHSSQTLTF